MKFIEKLLDKHRDRFEKGGDLTKWKPLFEATDTILFWTNERTKISPHVRDSLDLKRFMMMVIVALVPSTLFGIYNIGYQRAPDLPQSLPDTGAR